MVAALGTACANIFQAFGSSSVLTRLTPVRLPPGRLKLSTRPIATGSLALLNTTGIVVVAAFAASAAEVTAGRDDHIHPALHQIGQQLRQPIDTAFGPAILDGNVATFDEATLLQAHAERLDDSGVTGRRRRVDETNDRNGAALLRARGERTSGRKCSGDEIAPPHSITSSARASNVGGTGMPSALAVLMLITS